MSGGVGTAAGSAMLMAGPAYTTAGGSSGGMRVGSDGPENGRVGRWLRFRVSVHDALLASGREAASCCSLKRARATCSNAPAASSVSCGGPGLSRRVFLSCNIARAACHIVTRQSKREPSPNTPPEIRLIGSERALWTCFLARTRTTVGRESRNRVPATTRKASL